MHLTRVWFCFSVSPLSPPPDCGCRRKGGVGCAAGVCGVSGRAWERRAAVPWNLHHGAPSPGFWLPGPEGSGSRVSQPAECSTSQSTKRCLALWSGQSKQLRFVLLLSLPVFVLLYYSTGRHSFRWFLCLLPSREESKPSWVAFMTSWVKQTPPTLVSHLLYFIVVLSGINLYFRVRF